MEIAKKRVFKITQKPGVTAKNSTGLVDPRLFKGGNNLNAFQDSATCLWFLKYDIGGLPEELKDRRFTHFKDLHDYVKRYFSKRGLDVTYNIHDDVEDSHS